MRRLVNIILCLCTGAAFLYMHMSPWGAFVFIFFMIITLNVYSYGKKTRDAES